MLRCHELQLLKHDVGTHRAQTSFAPILGARGLHHECTVVQSPDGALTSLSAALRFGNHVASWKDVLSAHTACRSGLLGGGRAHSTCANPFFLFPGMHWGLEHSAGHYVDLAAAVLGLALFPVGYLLQALYQPNPGHRWR